jgi:hypothetical protein
MLQFRFGQFDQPGEALAMFCREILSFKKSPAMLDYSALALNQEGLDAGGPLKYEILRREPDAGQYVRHDRITRGPPGMRSAQSVGDRITVSE